MYRKCELTLSSGVEKSGKLGSLTKEPISRHLDPDTLSNICHVKLAGHIDHKNKYSLTENTLKLHDAIMLALLKEIVWSMWIKCCGNLNTGNDIASVESSSQLETLVRPVRHNKPSRWIKLDIHLSPNSKHL